MSSNHTPGPWRTFNWKGQETIVQNHVGQAIADCDVNRYLELSAKQANARLIAAAPELLEALQSIIEFANDPCGALHTVRQFRNQIEYERALSAIAKATGKQ